MRRLMEGLRSALSRSATFEVWTASAEGRPFFLEAHGLTRSVALQVAERYLQRRPPVPVLVVDEAGTPVLPVRRASSYGGEPGRGLALTEGA
jgi:hypothetical protein